MVEVDSNELNLGVGRVEEEDGGGEKTECDGNAEVAAETAVVVIERAVERKNDDDVLVVGLGRETGVGGFRLCSHFLWEAGKT